MDDFETPDTRPGYCPECSQVANIWNDMKRTWECCYCNWEGRQPLQELPQWS